MLPVQKAEASLLGPTDPEPLEVVNPNAASPVLLVCEHAGQAVPAVLGDLGIAATEMNRHIAYDIGAEGLARKLSKILDATLALQRYSRLVIDCNRPFEAADCMPESSDGTAIPVNCALTDWDRALRFQEIHRPFHDAIAGLLDSRQRDGRRTIIATIHSFTPRFANKDRPWLLGVCFNRDGGFAERFMRAFQIDNSAVCAAYNEPYTVDDLSDYTIPVHGERRRLPHVLLEVRNDEIADDAGQARWAQRIGKALTAASELLSRETSRGG
jgi:predicted N-formylglutamate amidohydrolase